jgi:serralysin
MAQRVYGIITAPGPGPKNEAIIKAFTPSGELLKEFQAFDKAYGANITSGDIDGDGIDEIIVGTVYKNNKLPALLGIFKRDGKPVTAIEMGHKDKVDGLTVASGDIDGDWVEEIAVGCFVKEKEDDDFGRGVVRIYRLHGEQLVDTGLTLHPYEEKGYKKAPNLVIADVDGDGVPELITAPGPDPNAPARIKIFKINTKDGISPWEAELVADFVVNFEKKSGDKDGYGANITAGDLDGDGKAEIIVGAGPDPKNLGQAIIIHNNGGTYTAETFLAHENKRYGVYVTSGDIDGDGKAEIVTGQGPDPKNRSVIRIFQGDGTLIREFQAYPEDIKYGVKISIGTVGEFL